MLRGKALLLAALVPAAALAGCAGGDEADAGTAAPISPGSTTSAGAPVTTAPSPVTEARPRGTSDRWHFHDYWKGQPTITLVSTNVTLNATVGADGLPALSALVDLPHGTIVPPETGFLTFNVTWEAATPGSVNLTYKPADSNDFQLAGDLQKGIAFQLNTTESNCDVPHRQSSAWRFNFTLLPPAPPDVPTGVPPRDFQVTIAATIGRPLFIDPPHLNWWRDGDILTIVEAATGEVRSGTTPAGNFTLPGGAPSVPPQKVPTAHSLQQTHRVPIDAGKIVPEGTKSVVAMLNWTSDVPDAKLALRYAENNYPTPDGVLELVSETPTSRVYSLKVAQAQTDTTYSNRTTWEFRVVPEGDPAAAFHGSFTLVAWAARYEPGQAVVALTAPPSR